MTGPMLRIAHGLRVRCHVGCTVLDRSGLRPWRTGPAAGLKPAGRLPQDRRGSSGLLLNVMRINNDNFCDLAALVTFDDSVPGVLKAKFLRYKNVPGLAIGHPSILYDNVTDLCAPFPHICLSCWNYRTDLRTRDSSAALKFCSKS